DHDPGAAAVVHAAGHRQVRPKHLESLGDDGTVAHRHAAGHGILTAGGADVDPHVLDLDDLLAGVLLEQVDGLLPHHAGDAARGGADPYPLPLEDLWVPAADGGEAQEPVVVDVGDLQADLVHVAGQHDPRAR